MNKNNRPVYLDLAKYRFPCTAIASILHRITGVLLFLLLPVLLWLLHKSLHSVTSYQQIGQHLANPVIGILLWITLACVFYHLIAGIRHLLMDAGIGESRRGGRIGAYLVMILGVVGLILAGVWIWV